MISIRNFVGVALALLCLGLANTGAFASYGIEVLFMQKYPALKNTPLDNCRACHSPFERDSLNKYGLDLKAANMNFAAIESKDSDGDGVSNIDEIRAEKLPGSLAPMLGTLYLQPAKGPIKFTHLAHYVNPDYRESPDVVVTCQTCHAENLFPQNHTMTIRKEVGHKICKRCHRKSRRPKAPKKDCTGCHGTGERYEGY